MTYTVSWGNQTLEFAPPVEASLAQAPPSFPAQLPGIGGPSGRTNRKRPPHSHSPGYRMLPTDTRSPTLNARYRPWFVNRPGTPRGDSGDGS